MIVKGVSGKSGFFLIELPIELPIGSCYSLVEEQQLLFPCGRTAAPPGIAFLALCRLHTPGLHI